MSTNRTLAKSTSSLVMSTRDKNDSIGARGGVAAVTPGAGGRGGGGGGGGVWITRNGNALLLDHVDEAHPSDADPTELLRPSGLSAAAWLTGAIPRASSILQRDEVVKFAGAHSEVFLLDNVAVKRQRVQSEEGLRDRATRELRIFLALRRLNDRGISPNFVTLLRYARTCAPLLLPSRHQFPDEQSFMHFTLESAGQSMQAVKNFTSTELRSVLFQILYALHVAQERFRFVHADLHAKNILVQRLPVGVDRIGYTVEGVGTFFVADYLIKLTDFGLSRLELPSGDVIYNHKNSTTHHFSPTLDSQQLAQELRKLKVAYSDESDRAPLRTLKRLLTKGISTPRSLLEHDFFRSLRTTPTGHWVRTVHFADRHALLSNDEHARRRAVFARESRIGTNDQDSVDDDADELSSPTSSQESKTSSSSHESSHTVPMALPLVSESSAASALPLPRFAQSPRHESLLDSAVSSSAPSSPASTPTRTPMRFALSPARTNHHTPTVIAARTTTMRRVATPDATTVTKTSQTEQHVYIVLTTSDDNDEDNRATRPGDRNPVDLTATVDSSATESEVTILSTHMTEPKHHPLVISLVDPSARRNATSHKNEVRRRKRRALRMKDKERGTRRQRHDHQNKDAHENEGNLLESRRRSKRRRLASQHDSDGASDLVKSYREIRDFLKSLGGV